MGTLYSIVDSRLPEAITKFAVIWSASNPVAILLSAMTKIYGAATVKERFAIAGSSLPLLDSRGSAWRTLSDLIVWPKFLRFFHFHVVHPKLRAAAIPVMKWVRLDLHSTKATAGKLNYWKGGNS
jgi:hypothetical protein